MEAGSGGQQDSKAPERHGVLPRVIAAGILLLLQVVNNVKNTELYRLGIDEKHRGSSKIKK